MDPAAIETFLQVDLPALLAATCAAAACALVGSFLVLRRASLMGDAISHAVLPGIVAAFLIAGSRAPLPMLLGAAAAGVAAAALSEVVARAGRLEPGAAMGVVFSVFFALGIVLLEQAAARNVDLDPDCVLHGQLEDVLWIEARDLASLARPETWRAMPHEVTTLGAVLAVVIVVISAFWKELAISSFDPALSTALGFRAGTIRLGLMVLVALVVVASFEAVGSILVIAMLVCPGAAARLLTDRLGRHVTWSGIIGGACAVAGYTLAAFGPRLIGSDRSLSAAGMIAVCSGAALALAVIASPAHGVIARAVRRRRLAARIAREDVMAILYRAEETAGRAGAVTPPERLRGALDSAGVPPAVARSAIRDAARRREIIESAKGLSLTDAGRDAARSLVRSHRLWESYLVRAMGLRPDHVHDAAMRLEHVTSAPMAEALRAAAPHPIDPQGKPIPEPARSTDPAERTGPSRG